MIKPSTLKKEVESMDQSGFTILHPFRSATRLLIPLTFTLLFLFMHTATSLATNEHLLDDDDPASPPSSSSSSAEPAIAWYAPKTIAEVGRSRIIAFKSKTPPPSRSLSMHFFVSDPDIIEIIGEPALADGETVGYLRILGLRPGRADVTVGNATISINVVPDRAPSQNEYRYAPKIIGPVNGTVVWGDFTVGVELREKPRLRFRRIARKPFAE